jgi:hypothetical protein
MPAGAGGGTGGFTSFADYLRLNPGEAQRSAGQVLDPIQKQLQGAQGAFDKAKTDFGAQMGQQPQYADNWWRAQYPDATPQGRRSPAERRPPNPGDDAPQYPAYQRPDADAAAARAQQGVNYGGPDRFGNADLTSQLYNSARNMGALGAGPAGWQALAGNPFDQSWGAAFNASAAQQGGAGRAGQMQNQQRDLSSAFGKFSQDASKQIGAARQGAADATNRMRQDVDSKRVSADASDWDRQTQQASEIDSARLRDRLDQRRGRSG